MISSLFHRSLKEYNIHEMFRNSQNHIHTQSTLVFTTRGLAANLDLATGRAITDRRLYIIATLGITTSSFGPYAVKLRPLTLLDVAISSGVVEESTFYLGTIWLLNQAGTLLICLLVTVAVRKTQYELY